MKTYNVTLCGNVTVEAASAEAARRKIKNTLGVPVLNPAIVSDIIASLEIDGEVYEL